MCLSLIQVYTARSQKCALFHTSKLGKWSSIPLASVTNAATSARRINHCDLAQAQKGHICVMQALVIGTDIPDISASVVDRAVAALDSHQVLSSYRHALNTIMLSSWYMHSCWLTTMHDINWIAIPHNSLAASAGAWTSIWWRLLPIRHHLCSIAVVWGMVHLAKTVCLLASKRCLAESNSSFQMCCWGHRRCRALSGAATRCYNRRCNKPKCCS